MSRVLDFPIMPPSPMAQALLYQAALNSVLKERDLTGNRPALSPHEMNVMVPAAYANGLTPAQAVDWIVAARAVGAAS